MNKYEEDELPQLEVPETPQEEQTDETTKPDLDGITKNYSAYVTATAFAALSTVFGILYFTQKSSYETARQDLKEEKREAKEQKRSDSLTISILRHSLDNCADATLEDLEKRIEQTQRLKLAVSSDYSKINKEIEIAKENAKELEKATKNVKKNINQ